MAAKRTPGSRPGLIRCENCGEQYSDTYRRCPFCDEYDEYEAEYESDDNPQRPARRGGKRLDLSKRRGGGYTRTSPWKVVSLVVSLAIIAAAIWIVATRIVPLILRGSIDTVDPGASVSQSADPGVSPGVPDPEPAASDPAVNASSAPDAPDAPDTPSVSSSGGADGFTLSKSEFSFSSRYPDPVTLQVVFTPAGAVGQITWSSSDPDIASVDENGTVTHGSKTGAATITAALSNGVTQTCKVYNQVAGSAAGEDSAAASGSYSINKADFTFYRVGETFQLKVNGYTGAVTWVSSDTGIATVSGDGTCTAVGTGRGSCTVTGTLDNGAQVEAIVRLNIT